MKKNNLPADSIHKRKITRFSVIILFFMLADTVPALTQGFPEEQSLTDRKIVPGDVLRKIHPTSLWQALKLLEPSIRESDENLYGSDPNHIPSEILINGTYRWPLNKLTSQALPTFILDDAVVEARRVIDLNIKDVAWVSLIKDGANLGSWGLRGGNGVIVIKTVRPEKGPLKINYSFDGSIQWADISSYKLMNGKEKISFEKEQGLYDENNPALSQLLKEREQAVAGGNTRNWLRVPLAVPFRQQHKVAVSGGDEFVSYQLGLRISPANKGVLSGSKRDIYGADAYISYRYKKLTLSNRLSIDKIYAKASPYGTYDFYNTINPYYVPETTDGILLSSLGEGSFNEQANPEYEYSLRSFRKEESYAIWNNFLVALELASNWELRGQFSFIREHSREDLFISPKSYLFSHLPEEEASTSGKYDIAHRNSTSYEGNLTLSFRETRNRSSYGASAALHLFDGKSDRDYYGGRGIPNDRMGFISFTSVYDPSLQPDACRMYDRLFSGTFGGFYAYDKRYILHALFRFDHSSRLAEEKRTVCYYGVSAQWNVHHENFWRENPLCRRLTVRGSIGTTGGVDFSEEAHRLKYRYTFGNEYIYNYFQIGGAIVDLPNPELKPRTTTHLDFSIHAETKWFDFSLNYFNHTTKNLLIIAPEALATGYESVPSNGGCIRNSGIEYNLSIPVINTSGGLGLQLYHAGWHLKNTIHSLPEYFGEQYNQSVRKGLPQFLTDGFRPGLLEEGKSLHTIYAVHSAGTDASGMENFHTLEGETTTQWQAKDLKACGNTLPRLSGTFGIGANWKQWDLTAHFNFKLGGKLYNETLHKVLLSAPTLNGDRRMADPSVRVKNAASILATSRLVESTNECRFSTLRIGFRFSKEELRRLPLQEMGIALTGNNLFSINSAEVQEGILYPFARSFTLSLHATF